MKDIIMIVVCLAGGGLLLKWLLFHKSGTDEVDTAYAYVTEDSVRTLSSLSQEIKNIFSGQLRTSLSEENLSYRSYIARKLDKRKLETSLNDAPHGDLKAKTDVINRIKGILTAKTFPYRITESDIDSIIPFDAPDRMTTRDIHEVLIYIYTRKYGPEGYDRLIDEYNLERTVIGTDSRKYYKITDEMIRDAYQSVMSGKSAGIGLGNTLVYTDKLNILTQLLYARTYGFGVVDSLYYQDIEEIDCGVSGIPLGGFNIAAATAGNDIRYSYQSVWIMRHGRNIHLDYLGFESEADFERVASNIYRYNATNVLSQTEGIIVSSTPDGSRIAVTRPPASESWAFFLRKFRPETKAPKLSDKIDSAYKWIPICLLKWGILTEQSTIITGATGTGKTTLLKTILRYIRTEMNLRILEMTLELSVRYMYKDLNCLTLQRTGTLTTARESDFLKKTNVAVTIMGEIAEPDQTVEFIKKCQVNSRFGLGTHHANSTDSLIDSLAGDYTELGMYKDKNDAVSMIARTVNLDCHLAFSAGIRHIDYINEIIPYTDIKFPTDTDTYADKPLTYADRFYLDANKALRDMVAPKLYVVRNLCRWTDSGDIGDRKKYGHFELSDDLYKDGPSERTKSKAEAILTEADRTAFYSDMDALRKAWGEVLTWWDTHGRGTEPEYTSETSQWIQRILSE